MTRRIYLIRHGKPDFPEGICCLGRTDMPLGPVGRMQACLAARELENAGIGAVFTSPLSRARETASYLSASPVAVPGLMEAGMGIWDGLSFREIKERYPELYERRGADMSVSVPDAEPPAAALERFDAAVRQCLRESSGCIAIVAHAAVIKLMLAAVSQAGLEASREYRLHYCACAQLEYDGGFRLVRIGAPPHPALDRDLCLRLLRAAGTPTRVIAHCAAVTDEAVRLAGVLRQSGVAIDTALVENAAMLHDLARAQPEHAARGADWLGELGYPALADIISGHHDLPDHPSAETELLYLSDKLVAGTEIVSLEERFSESYKKCTDDNARRNWERRRSAAEKIVKKYRLEALV